MHGFEKVWCAQADGALGALGWPHPAAASTCRDALRGGKGGGINPELPKLSLGWRNARPPLRCPLAAAPFAAFAVAPANLFVVVIIRPPIEAVPFRAVPSWSHPPCPSLSGTSNPSAMGR
eukprot:scaffold256668_cov35-Tisochrysis_lutea.AAC.1